MKKKQVQRLVAFSLATMMTLQGLSVNASGQVQVRTDSNTKMSSDKEVVYVNTYDTSKRVHDFDANWKFYLGDADGAEAVNFDDSAWRTVSVPHDYSIEQEYTQSGEAESGYLPGGTGWYRKHFTLTEDMKDKEIRLDFGGVYMNATVWVNGTQLGTHPYGYTPFSFDITDYVKAGEENVITVKVDHQTPSSRWYSGSGIYRSVDLTVMDKVHVDLNGTKIATPNLAKEKDGDVNMDIVTTVANEEKEAKEITLVHTLREKGKKDAVATVTTERQSVEAGKTADIKANLKVNQPKLWGLGEKNAHLYTVTTEVKVNDKVVDTYDTDYGFRYTELDTKTGFSLNGEKVKLQGVCMHHDQGALGAEAQKRAIERQVEILQEMGCNSIRVTHNPAAEELIEVCNEKGILVINELFDGWHKAKNGNVNDYAKWFNQTIGDENKILDGKSDMTWAEFDLKSTLNQGKNDPSIIMWSLGNEISEGASEGGYYEISKNLIKWAQEIDTSKPLTIGSNRVKGAIGQADNEHIKIANDLTKIGGMSGTNYSGGSNYDALHSTYPEWFLYGSETASAVNSRGVYTTKANAALDQDKQLTSYDKSKVNWGALASEAWYDVITRDFVAGEYVWTGFDYIGEPTPANKINAGAATSWPSPKNSYFGIVDTAGLPKDSYYFYQSQWNDEVNTLHVLPTWNEDSLMKDENGNVEVVVYSDAAKVKLFLNDKEIAEQTFEEHTTGAGYKYQTVKGKTGHESMYMTFSVPYEKGTLKAVAYDKDGNEIKNTQGRSSVTTTDKATKLDATVDRNSIKADGKDLSYITVDVTDANGNIVPDADNNVRFTVEGAGTLVGVDNGKQADHQSYQDDNRDAYNGSLVAIVQSTKDAGKITVKAEADGLTLDTVEITTTEVEDGTVDKTQVDSFYMSKHYYVKAGSKVQLPETIKTRFKDGTEKDLPVKWDEIKETTGSFVVNGLVDGKYKVSVTVNVIDQLGGLMNYSATTPKGTEPNLPTTRPAIAQDGTVLNVSFPVTWGKVDKTKYDEPGIVTVNGTSNVLGTAMEVTASIRVQEETYEIVGSVDNPSQLTQDIEKDKQSDTLDAVWDGKTAIADNTSGGPNPTAWSNYKNSQAGDNTAEITFQYATQQVIGEVTVHFFKDSASARYPKAGTTKLYVKANDGDDWQEVVAEETIGEENGRVKAYTYKFNPVGATLFKVAVTNSDEVLTTGHKPCTGITEIEIKKAVGSYKTNTTAKLASLEVNGKALTAEELAENAYYTLDKTATVTAAGADNAAVTVLPVHNKQIRILIESEDHRTKNTFVIYLEQEKPMSPDDDSKDYPVDKLTAISGSQYLPGTTNEGPDDFVLDGKANTYWHTNWSTTEGQDINKRWIGVSLDEPTEVSAIRYLPRNGNNGHVTEYKVQYRATDDGKWEDLASGTWDNPTTGWKLVTFPAVEAKQVRLIGVHTIAEAGRDLHMTTAEFRVVSEKEVTPPDPEEPEVKPGEDYPVGMITGTAGSTQPGNGVEKAFDGKTNTWWHSSWNPASTADQLWFTMELKEAATLDQLRYYPRYEGTNLTQGDQNGFISKYKVEVSMDNEEWTKVAEGSWEPKDGWLTADFTEPTEAKYVRITGVETMSNGEVKTSDMAIAELRVRVAKGEEPEKVDKTALQEAIEAAGEMKEAEFTPNSWKAFKEALDAAKAVEKDEKATQTDVNEALAALEAAKGALVKKADKTELNKAMEAAKALKEADYTSGSWNVLKEALEVAKTVQNDENVSQASVKAATDGLNEAMEALVKKANKTELDKAIKAAEALNEDDYTADSWKVFAQELADAYTVSRNADATQAEVDEACKALKAAREALVEKEEPSVPENVDKAAAQKYYDDCLAYYEKDDYTADSWKVYAEAMDDLKAALADEDISKEDLQAAVDAVAKAVEGLEKAGTAAPDPKPEEKPGQKPQQKPAKTGDNMSTGAIVGIVVVAVLAIGVIVGVIISKKRKK